ncbi:MAG: hypothetical protein ABIW76_24165 [Fibrobacteria bacterium]
MKISNLGLLLLTIASGISHANTCADGKQESHMLPERIGRPESGIPEAYLLKCDTMEVGVGDTTRIFSSQKVHFGPASTEKKIILVRGTLIVEGTANSPTMFAGSLTEFEFGLKPGKAAWGGFRVAETGTLILKNAMINNATFAIDSRSQNVRLEHIYTKGCLNLVKPGNEFVKLDFTGTTITSLDFSPDLPKVAEPVEPKGEKDSSEKTEKKKNYSKPLVWGGIGVASLGIAGVAIWLASSADGGSNKPPNPDVQTFPGDLGFPQTDGPRKP